MIASTLITLALSAAAIATPANLRTSGCSLTNVAVAAGTLPAPSAPLTHVALGVGFQNYTCNAATSTYTAVGAVADIFDISCLAKQKFAFENIADFAMTVWEKLPTKKTPSEALKKLAPAFNVPTLLGEHFFITNPITGTGISPEWDFSRTYKTNTNAVVVAARNAGIPAPEGAKNVDWLHLKAIQGDLAAEIYRTDTRKGQPPASCVPGTSQPVQVKYVSKYWFTGGSVKK